MSLARSFKAGNERSQDRLRRVVTLELAESIVATRRELPLQGNPGVKTPG